MPDSPPPTRARELSALLREQAKRVRREATIAVQLAAQLDDELTGEDTSDSPKEGTPHEQHQDT